APQSHAFVVFGHMLNKVVDGVVSVRALVDPLLAWLEQWAHVHELPLTHELSSHILKREDVARFLKLEAAPEVDEPLGSVRPDTVGRAHHQDGMFARLIPWHVADRVKFYPVPHRDLVFDLLVTLGERKLLLSGSEAGKQEGGDRPPGPKPIHSGRIPAVSEP